MELALPGDTLAPDRRLVFLTRLVFLDRLDGLLCGLEFSLPHCARTLSALRDIRSYCAWVRFPSSICAEARAFAFPAWDAEGINFPPRKRYMGYLRCFGSPNARSGSLLRARSSIFPGRAHALDTLILLFAISPRPPFRVDGARVFGRAKARVGRRP